MTTIDLDQTITWPSKILQFLEAQSKTLREEILKDRAHARKGLIDRCGPSPSMPSWEDGKLFIESELTSRSILAFHATRLIDFNCIQVNGLIPLDIKEQAERIKGQLCSIEGFKELEDFENAVQIFARDKFDLKSREGSVWLVPLRRLLHDGNCEEFFLYYGGEAINRIALIAGEKIQQCLKKIGTPAVVVAEVPIFGWCSATESRIALAMVELYLEKEGNWTAREYSWDISIPRDIPGKYIRAVVPQHDFSVGWRP